MQLLMGFLLVVFVFIIVYFLFTWIQDEREYVRRERKIWDDIQRLQRKL